MATSTRDLQKGTSTLLGTAAAVCFIYFVAALLLLHALKPEYTIVDHMISDYAVGRLGWVMTSAFVSASLGSLSLAAGLLRSGPRSLLAKGGAVLLLVASIGLAVTAAFPTDLETAPSTPTGDIHALSFFVNIVAILLAAIFLALSYACDAYWRRRMVPALLFSAVLLAAFVAQFLTLHKGAPYGITNRAFVAVLMAWFITTSFWLRQVAGEVGRGQAGQPPPMPS